MPDDTREPEPARTRTQPQPSDDTAREAAGVDFPPAPERDRDRVIATPIDARSLVQAIERGERTFDFETPAEIRGPLVLRGREFERGLVIRNARFRQIVDLEETRFGRTLDLSDCVFEAGLLLDLARIEGHLDLARARLGANLDARNARVQGALDCSAAPAPLESEPHLDFELGGESIDLAQARVAMFRIDGRCLASEKRIVDLTLARVDRVVLLHDLPARITAEELEFRHVELPPGRSPVECLRRTHPFRKSTYKRMEQWLRNKGHDDEADRVYRDMRNRDLADERFRTRWFLETLFLRPIGYGTRNWILVIVLALQFLAMWWLLSHPSAVEPRPDEYAAVAFSRSVAPENPDSIPPWTSLKAAWLALRVTLPMLLFLAADTHDPSEEPLREVLPESLGNRLDGTPLAGIACADLASLVSVVSWVLVPVFLAGISGWIKRQA